MPTRSPRKGHGGRVIGLNIIILEPPPPAPAAHKGGAALPPEAAVDGTAALGKSARGIVPTAKDAVTNSRLRGTLQVRAPGQRLIGRRLQPRRHGLIHGGRAKPPGQTPARVLATLPRNQAPHPHGAARRRHGLGPALNPHRLMPGGGLGFLLSHMLVPFRRARAPLQAFLFRDYNGSPKAGQRRGRGGERPGRSPAVAAPQTTRSWFTTRRPSS